MSTDTLSDVLRAVRLTGAVFYDVHAGSPWVAETLSCSEIGSRVMPGADHVIEYHVITQGTCWGGLLDQSPQQFHAGDILVFPQGDAHVLSSAPGMRVARELSEFHNDPEDVLPFVIDLNRTGPNATHVVCGFLGCDTSPFNPILANLPRMIHMRGRGASGARGHLIELALAESRERRAGGACTLSRLSELLFIEAVRDYLAELPPENASWLTGLRDPVVGKALAALHERPAHAWTLDGLARQVGASRSVLAERFPHFVGMAPMQYLAQWRMQLAAHHLTDGDAGMAEIAERVGYGSEAAFSRAYKRLVGVAPAAWRQGARATPP